MKEMLITEVGAAVLITDRNGRILSANTGACRMFAHAEKELTGKDILHLLGPGGTNELRYELSVSEMQLQQQGVFVVVLYTAPEASTRSAQELARLKTRFMALASHEFRSPLSTIQLSADLIGRYYDLLDREKLWLHLGKIRLAVTRLTGMLDEFMSMEPIGEGHAGIQLEAIDLPAFCAELIREMRLQAKPGQQLSSTHAGARYWQLNRKMLRYCLVNLLANAINYAGDGSLIRLCSRIDGDGCALQLSDTGPGIPPEDQSYIFEPFFRAGNVMGKQGIGLRLSLVRHYCGLMDGQISLESRPAEGSVFTLWFPTRPRPAVPR